MLSVVMLALVFRRRIHPHTSLALALFIILLLAPFSVNQPGFWLSFIAVGLLLFTIDRHVQDTRIRKWSRAQWVLMVGMLPLNLLFFKGTPLVAPLANLVAIPWIGLTVLPPALLGTFMQHLGFEVGAMLLNLAELSLALIWPVLEYLQGMPIAWLAVSAPGPILLLLAGTGIVLILAPSGWPGRALGGVFLLPLFVTPAPRPEPGGFWIEMLDVGEGLATVIRTREHTLIYDTGPRFSPRFDTGSAVILPYLYQNQINRIDTLIISHGDNDHIGGAHSLMDALPVQRILTSVPEKLNADVEYCMEGQTWSWDGVQFQVLHPKRDWPFTGNNGSCVLRVHNMQNSVLLTGDIESISEFRLRRDLGDTLASDILFIPHHGSLTSSTSELIMTVEPDLALVSAGYQNRFGFPKEEVTKRYTERGIPILNTAEYGAVHIEFTANGRTPRIEPYLSIHQRYWYSGLDSLP
jgi:competence protein ComEC